METILTIIIILCVTKFIIYLYLKTEKQDEIEKALEAYQLERENH